MTLLNRAGTGFVTKIPHLVHLRGHALKQCSMAVFNPQFQRTRYQGRHGSNTRAWSMDIQDALDLHLKEEAFRIIGKSNPDNQVERSRMERELVSLQKFQTWLTCVAMR